MNNEERGNSLEPQEIPATVTDLENREMAGIARSWLRKNTGPPAPASKVHWKSGIFP